MKLEKSSGMTRRVWLKALAGVGSGAALSGCSRPPLQSGLAIGQTSAGGKNSVRQENQNAGTHEWLLTNPRIDPGSKYRCPWIEGYCSRASFQAGDSLSLFVSTNPDSDFSIEIYRMGYYGGAGGCLVRKLGPFRGRTQPDSATGRN